jgi:hypothetical protein
MLPTVCMTSLPICIYNKLYVYSGGKLLNTDKYVCKTLDNCKSKQLLNCAQLINYMCRHYKNIPIQNKRQTNSQSLQIR